MEDRIAVLEREVAAIKSEVAEIRRDQLDHANATELNARTSRIELDLVVIKGDLAQVRLDIGFLRNDVAQLQKDVQQLQIDVALLQRDVGQLQNDLASLDGKVGEIKAGMLAMQLSITEIKIQIPNLATKAELEASVNGLEARIKGWMLMVALAIISANLAIVYPLYGALKAPALVKPAQAAQVTPLATPAPAVTR
jgi:chromosome segregation ATPase